MKKLFKTLTRYYYFYYICVSLIIKAQVQMIKLFKFENEVGSYIRAIEGSEIKKQYNCYGLFYKNEQFKSELETYKVERNEFIAELISDANQDRQSLTLDDIKELIVEFQSDYQYETQKESGLEGRPELFVEIDDSEDSYYSDPTGFYLEPCESSIIEDEDEVDVVSTFINEWDGSNWRKTILSSESGHLNIEDVTDEYGDIFKRATDVFSSKDLNSKSWEEYSYDKKTSTLLVKSISLWAGSVNSFAIVENEDTIDILFAKYSNDDTIRDCRPEMFEKYEGEDLQVYKKADYCDASQDEYFNETDHLVVFSKQNAIDRGSWVNDPYNRTSGGTNYELPSGLNIQYTWSAYQGDWCGFSEA